MKSIIVNFAKVSDLAIIPSFAHDGDSGFDLYIIESAKLMPNERKALKTGLKFDLPYNYEIQVRPRSGVSTNTKLVIIFATIDSCYRGEIHIIAHNTDTFPICLEAGQSIAQGVINRLPSICIKETDLNKLSHTCRGSNGFGSTAKIKHFSREG